LKAENLWSDYSARGWRKKPLDDEVLYEKPTRISGIAQKLCPTFIISFRCTCKSENVCADIEEMCAINQNFYSTFKVLGEEHLFKPA